MEKIKVGAVSYLNTKPFLYGLDQSPVKNEIELTLENPAQIANNLLARKIDVGLIPVKSFSSIEGAQVISDFGIACDGAVGSVVICSQVSMRETDRLFLDYQSQTSVALAKILVRDFWKSYMRLAPASPGYEKQVMGKYAGLFIGDRALKLRELYDYVYDLGEAWKKFTGKPFVFAVWAANRTLPIDFIASLNAAFEFGINHLDEVIQLQQPNYPGVDVADYLKNKIHYRLDESKKEALEYFLRLSKEREAIPS